jgi:hypothetical protein
MMESLSMLLERTQELNFHVILCGRSLADVDESCRVEMRSGKKSNAFLQCQTAKQEKRKRATVTGNLKKSAIGCRFFAFHRSLVDHRRRAERWFLIVWNVFNRANRAGQDTAEVCCFCNVVPAADVQPVNAG